MKTILVVEDDRQYRKILEQELTEQKYTVLLAENGAMALETMKKNKPDLILLDLLMPDMDGTTFYYHLKNELKSQVPIIILTNVADTAAYGEHIKDVFIKSNVELKDVVKRIKEIL